MIHYVKGNLLESHAEALVNTVNTVGVMGKGIALQFREAYPHNYKVYQRACKDKQCRIGEMLIVEENTLLAGRKLIVNFPTKKHWRYPSDYAYVEQGLQALRRDIVRLGIHSIAIPPLGTHNGGLEWSNVKQMIEQTLGDLDCEIYLYEPSDAIIERLKTERVKLTPARAMLLWMFGEVLAYGEFASVFTAEKLIYFMQRLGAKEYFNIDFQPQQYGPYSGGKVAHMLYYMNGSYIKGMGSMEVRPFDYIWVMDIACKEAQDFIDHHEDKALRTICQKTDTLLQGYYANSTLELLSSVDYLLCHTPQLHDWQQTDRNQVLDILEHEMAAWSKRKERLFNRNLIAMAVNHLEHNLSYDQDKKSY